MTQGEEQLRLLSIFHYVVGGLAGLFALLPIVHLTFGLIMLMDPEAFTSHGEKPLPAFLGWLLVIFASFFIAVGWIFAALVITTGRFLARRRHHLFCLVMAGIEYIFMPFGTVLGVFTLVVLMRDSVRQLFSASESVAPSS
jgi:hypothetical protein